jgi:spermidine/putrescine transport system ATP-binding protein
VDQFSGGGSRRDLEGAFVNLHFLDEDNHFSVHQTNVDLSSFEAGAKCTIGFDENAGMILPAGELADE